MKHLGTRLLETDRLILRQCIESDYKDSYKYCCSDPELCRLQWFDISPYPDVYNVIQVIKKVPKNKKVLFYEDSLA